MKKKPCTLCKNYILKPDLKLFSDSDLSNPEVLKANNEFESQKNARRILESNNVKERPFLNYEPNFYGWCQAMFPYSRTEHGEILNKIANQEIKTEEAAKNLRDITKELNDLKNKAQKNDFSALEELNDRNAVEIGDSTGTQEYYYAIAQNVNLNNKSDTLECPLYEIKASS